MFLFNTSTQDAFYRSPFSFKTGRVCLVVRCSLYEMQITSLTENEKYNNKKKKMSCACRKISKLVDKHF